jgi:hypothetical protein
MAQAYPVGSTTPSISNRWEDARYRGARAEESTQNGSTVAAFRGDPGPGNLRHTTIECLTLPPGMRARGFG